jgi:hypothetical protein
MTERNFTQEELNNPSEALIEELKGLGEHVIRRYIFERNKAIN